MYREIKKKKVILDNRKPYSAEASRFLYELNSVDWIFSSIRLDGYSINRDSVERIVKGEFLVNQSVDLHRMISNMQQVIKSMDSMAQMDTNLNEAMLFTVYNSLEGLSGSEYRKSNPILHMLNYNPPHFKEVEEQMELLFQWLYQDQGDGNPMERAAFLHNKLIEIYPFEIGTERLARTLAQYQLIRSGLPPIQWNMSEQEYYDSIKQYLKNEEIQPIYDALERGVYNKLEIMMQLTSE